ncbi:flavodoxin domain-containing protein [Sedimentitalea sp.]|uniref:flavodoxin domain-containing protein n=1 Tax=Sedimentitalea sp. TaxID=2048915 RepID=UPI003298BB23
MKITLLYGTETGNAEMLADDIQAELEDAHEVACGNLEDFAPADFDSDCFYLLVCSTYGDGDLPASAQPFAEAMADETPDLNGVYFAIFGLGDREYDTFAQGSEKLAALMAAHGASQLGDRIIHDASGDDLAEDLAFPWAQAMVELAQKRLSQAA